ncbi:MAG: glycosyltransferase family 4 protein [Acaryochloridaceae cyanobacterium RU_4_10]|nr:glycosyltransferase family 4 protein [Acaryochloridaceae cyanobacterium RU_4_10]
MDKKKIGVVIYANPDYYPPTVNAIRLLSAQFDVVLIGRNYDPIDCEYPNNVRVIRLGKYSSIVERMQASSANKFWEYINFIVNVKDLFKDVSLIYAYDSFGYVAAYLSRFFSFHKAPTIYQNHEISKYMEPLHSLTGWIQRAEKKFIHKANIVVFPDRDRANLFQTQMNLSRQPIIVPNFPLNSQFVLDENWMSIIEMRWKFVTLFYRGWISETSSMKEMITTTSLLSKLIKHINIRFVGFIHDDVYNDLKNWVNCENISNRFSYLGVLPYKDLQDPTFSSSIGFALYKNKSFDRVACASACNKIYEYAACGLPVVVSDFSTYRDYLSGESWVRFADPDDPHSIVSAVLDILSDLESYKSMCVSARTAFEQKFNYESVFSPLLADIKSLVA